MPAAKKNSKAENGKMGPARSGTGRKVVAIIGLIVILVAIGGALAYTYEMNGTQQQTSFTTFQHNFNSAPSVSIYAVGSNGADLASVIGCSTQLIEGMITSQTNHRNATSIHYYVMNSTLCEYSSGVIGSGSGTQVNATPSECLALGTSEPSIFVNYSTVNSTIITPSALYLNGNAAFMQECGIASEISSG